MDDWEWLRKDWLEVASQAVLFTVLFLGGRWIVRWLLPEQDPKKKRTAPRYYTRKTRRPRTS
jgi:hypothetical protein